MKLKFKNQGFQEAATAAVCDVFNGQPYHDPNVYTVDPGPNLRASASLRETNFPALEVEMAIGLAVATDRRTPGFDIMV